MVTDYTSATAISNFLGRALTAYETANVQLVIDAVKAWIDNYTSSNFSEVGVTTRYYDGGGHTVDIDPATSVTTVSDINNFNEDNYDYVLYNDYVLEPQNSNVKREIVRRQGKFPHGNARVAVTAKFSEYDGGIPADIQMVATRLAANVLQSGKIISQGNISRESLEGHEIMYNSQAMLNDVASNDPFISGALNQRREPLVY